MEEYQGNNKPKNHVNRRLYRNIIVNPKLQWGLFFYFLFSGLMLLTFIYLSNQSRMERVVEVVSGLEPSEAGVLLNNLSDMMILEYIGIAVMLIIFAAGLLLISHKVAGPIYKLRRSMVDCRENSDYQYVFFRRGDYFHELAKAYNELIDFLRKNPS